MKVSGSVVNGSGYLNHNKRKFTRGNVDRARTKDNIYLERESVEEAYQRLFSDSIDRYNEGQKRSDRKKTVEGYLQELENNKHKKGAEKPFYEVIVQIGDKDTCNCQNDHVEANNAKKALLKYYETWKERNPNLKTFNVSLHMDEATPHIHIDYIPVGRGYKQGLQERNSLSKALENQGLGKHINQYDNGAVRWQEQERKALQEIAKEFGFEIEEKGVNREHLSVAEYKREKEKIKQELELAKGIEVKGTSLAMGRIMVKQEELDHLNKVRELQNQQELALQKELKAIQAIEQEIKVTYEHARQRLIEQERLLELAKEKEEKARELKKEAEQAKALYEEKYSNQLSLNSQNSQLKKDLEQYQKLYNSKLKENDRLKEEAKILFTEGYKQGLSESKDEIEKSFRSGKEEGINQGRNEGMLTALVKTNAVFYQEGGMSLISDDGKTYTVVEPNTGFKLRVSTSEKERLLVVPKDKIEKVNQEINEIKKTSYTKVMGQGRSR